MKNTPPVQVACKDHQRGSASEVYTLHYIYIEGKTLLAQVVEHEPPWAQVEEVCRMEVQQMQGQRG